MRESDFRRHGHDLDPNYANVMLHVVFKAENVATTPLPGGGSAPVLALPLPTRRGQGWDPRRAWAEPCATALSRLGHDACAAVLDRLGEMRFRQKSHAARKRLEDCTADDVLWAALLEGLGYGGLRAAFQEVADGVLWGDLREEMLSSGESCWAKPAHSVLAFALSGASSQDLRSARPGNRMEERLSGASALAARFAVNGPARALLPLVSLPCRQAAAALVEALTVPKLIGRGRAIELALNAVLPLAAALAERPPDEAQVEGVYAALPAPAKYGAVRHLDSALDSVGRSARRSQGMLYLLKQYCTQGGCGKCPLS